MAVNDIIPTDVEELKDIELTGPELRFVMAYLSPQCNFDHRKALRSIMTDEEFNSITKPTFYARARSMVNKENVQLAIQRLMSKEVERKKSEILPMLVGSLITASNFDPAEIIDDDGDLLYGSLKAVPTKLRQDLIEGISVKYWGKNCDIRTREVKLVSKTKARSQLIDMMKVIAQLDAKNEDTGKSQFVVNIGTSDIPGMATAKELFAQAADLTEVQEEADNDREV